MSHAVRSLKVFDIFLRRRTYQSRVSTLQIVHESNPVFVILSTFCNAHMLTFLSRDDESRPGFHRRIPMKFFPTHNLSHEIPHSSKARHKFHSHSLLPPLLNRPIGSQTPSLIARNLSQRTIRPRPVSRSRKIHPTGDSSNMQVCLAMPASLLPLQRAQLSPPLPTMITTSRPRSQVDQSVS